MNKLILRTPDDCHIHLRDGDFLARTVPDVARTFARAIVMPNLNPPVVTVADALAYRDRITAACPSPGLFTPLMTLYLTPETTVSDVRAAKDSKSIVGFKWYPKAATTHSDYGITDIKPLYPVLAALQEHQMPLLIHGESIDQSVDVFDREAAFIDQELKPLLTHFPQLRIVLEHITSTEAVDFMNSCSSGNVGATITAHHLLLNRNDLFVGGIKPHYYCLPILKREKHQRALIQAATSGKTCFFLGTDSAPHAVETKESACGCAGIYTAHAALELYAEVFESENALDKLEDFASRHGASFYRLPVNQGTIEIEKKEWHIPNDYSFGTSRVIPLRAGSTLQWQVKSRE